MCYVDFSKSGFFVDALQETGTEDQDNDVGWIELAKEIDEIMEIYREVLREYKNERWV